MQRLLTTYLCRLGLRPAVKPGHDSGGAPGKRLGTGLAAGLASLAAGLTASLAASLLFVGNVQADSAAGAGGPGASGLGVTVLVLGDSISAGYGIQREDGWVALLEQRLRHLHAGHRVVNASVSGETTGGGLARLPAALTAHEPDLVLVELGGNDGLRGYPVPRIAANLRRMVELAQAAGAEVLLLGMQIPPNYGPRYTRAFHQAFREVAEVTGTALVPFLLEDVALADGLMQADGIHPTAAAQPLMLDAVWPYLEPLVADTAVPSDAR